MEYKYLWQLNKNKPDGRPDNEVIKGLFAEANAYMRERLKVMGGETSEGNKRKGNQRSAKTS